MDDYVDKVEDLLQRAKHITATVEAIQADLPSKVHPQTVLATQSAYERWYAEAKSLLSEVLLSRLEQHYYDRDGRPRIKSFWSAPTAIEKSLTAQLLPGFIPEEQWRFPQHATFQEPFLEQQRLLRLARLTFERDGYGSPPKLPKSAVGYDLRQALGVVGKDNYILSQIDDLFLSAGAEESWLVEPLRVYRSERITRVHSWIEGISLYAPYDEVEIVRRVTEAVLSNPNLPGEYQSALRAGLEKLKPARTAHPATQSAPLASVGKDKPAIFIGHGRSKIYQELVLHLRNEWDADVIFFEDENRTGQQITSVLDKMLPRVTCAIILLTAEDEQKDGTMRARQNVIHEAGLLHGRVGFDRVALLKPSNVERFTNMDGLIYVPLDEKNIEHSFHRIDGFLKNCELKRKD